MANTNKTLRAGIAAILVMSAMSLTACGKKISAAQTVIPSATAAPIDNTPIYDTPTYDDNSSSTTLPTATPNTQVGSFNTDQDFLNSWQARGIAVTGGTIYLTVADTSGLSKKGSVVKMNSSDGKSWKDIGSKYLGVSHPMASTVGGLAVSGTSIVAVDTASKTYIIDGSSSGSVKTLSTGGGTDAAAGGGSVFIANGTVDKSDSSASSRSPLNGLSSSGGIGADNMGNVYAISGVTIKKADPTGQVQDVITTDLTGPLDVAADSRNGDIYVLDGNMVKRFTASGQLLCTFSSSCTKPVGIAVDESGAVYVADAGSTYKDSKVIKFAASVDNASSMSSGYNSYSSSNSGYDYSSSSNGAYGTYSATPSTTSTANNSTARRQQQ